MIKRFHYTFVILLCILAIITCFEQYPNAVLSWYSNGCYPYIGALLRAISDVFPLAIGDVLYAAVIILCIRWIYLFIKRLRARKHTRKIRWETPFRLANTFLIAVIVFKLIWAINYSRPPVNTQLGISDEPYTVNDLVKLGGYFILKLEAVKPDRSTYYSTFKLEHGAIKAYQALEKKHKIFNYSNPSLKGSRLNSWMMTRLGLEGYYNPFSGEANINTSLPQFELPFTTCHEIAHQLGIAREDEANLIGYLAAINSGDVNFRYSAYYNILRSILFELSFKSPEQFKAMYDLLPRQVLADLQTERQFWRKHNSKMFDYMDAALDSYLKINKQRMGIKSYQNIVLWVYNLHKDEL